MQDQLHAAGFVEESFGNDGPGGRHDAERGLTGADVRHRLTRARVVETALLAQERLRRRVVTPVDLFANGAHLA